MARLTVEEIVSAKDLGEEAVEMPEWGGDVLIRGLGYGEWVDLRDSSTIAGVQDEKVFSRLLFATSIVEPHVTPEQADLLIGKSSVAVNRLVEKIVALSNIGVGSVTEAEAGFPD
jgi:hypothetical protein